MHCLPLGQPAFDAQASQVFVRRLQCGMVPEHPLPSYGSQAPHSPLASTHTPAPQSPSSSHFSHVNVVPLQMGVVPAHPTFVPGVQPVQPAIPAHMRPLGQLSLGAMVQPTHVVPPRQMGGPAVQPSWSAASHSAHASPAHALS
jgi:hypothetical protein